MIKKSNYLKNLLTTASTLVVLTGGGQVAEAVAVVTGGTPALVQAGGSPNLLAFVNGVDTIQLGGAHDLITGGNVDLSAGVIDINGNGNRTFTVRHLVTYGAALDLDMKLIVDGGAITVQDVTNAADDVTVTAGNLIMRNAGRDLLANGGVTTVNNVARDVTLTLGADVTQTGTVGRNLNVGGAALYKGAVGADVAGTVIINTTNAGINTLHDAADAVTLTAGNLTMNDATAAGQDVTVTAGNLIMRNAGRDLLANGGVTTVNNVARDVTLTLGADVTQTGTVGRNLNVGGAALYKGAVGADVAGTVIINTTNAGINTLHDAADAVTLTAGNLTMNDATAAGQDVTVTAGNLIMRNAGRDLLANGGVTTVNNVARDVTLTLGADVTQTGTVGRNLNVGGAALYKGAVGADVAGTVIINTTNAGINTLHDAADAVTLTAGNLTMNDATAAGQDVTVTAGNLIMRNAGRDLLANGGVTTVNNVARDVTLTLGADVTQTGTVGRNLNVGGAALYKGAVGADVAGTVIINTTNAGINTLHDAADAVTLTAGNLTMNDATAAGQDVTVTAGNLIMRNAGRDLLANGGVTTVNNVARDVTLTLGADVTQTGTVGRNLNVGGAALYKGAVGADVAGTVIINTTNAGINTLHDAADAVTLTAGNLTMNDATAAGQDVTVTAGNLIMRNAGRDLLANGGVTTVNNVARDVTLTLGADVTQTGTVGRNLNVGGAALYKGAVGADVAGTVIINTTNAGINTLHDAADAVTLTAGNLTMNDATAAGQDVTVTAGNLIMRNAGRDLLANGGVTTVNKVSRHAHVRNGAVLSVKGDIGGDLDNLAGNNATVNLTGVGNVVGTVGNTGAIAKLSVSADRTFAGARFNVTELNFADNAKVDLNNAGADLAGANVTLDKTGNHLIQVNGAQIITGAINASGKMNTAGDGYGLRIKVMGGAPVAVGVNTANFKADLLADQSDKVTLTLGANTTSTGKLGSEQNRFVNTIFNNVAELTVGDIYSKDIHVAAGVKSRYVGKVVGDKITLAGLDSQAKFTDGTRLQSRIVGTAGNGLVEFEGAVKIDEAIGGVKRVKFSATSPAIGDTLPKIAAKLNKNIESAIIDGGNVLLLATNNATLSGATTAKYVGANAGKTLTFNSGPLKLEGDAKVYSEITASDGGLKAGKVVTKDNALDLTNLQSTTIVIDDKNSGIPVEGRQFTLFENETGMHNGDFAANLAVLNLNENSLARWTVVSDDKANIVATQHDDSKRVLGKNLTDAKCDANDFVNLDAVRQEPGILEELFNMTPEARVDLIRRVPSPNIMPTVLASSMREVHDNMGVRLSSLSGIGSPVQNKRIVDSAGSTGISSGDEESRYGAWLNPTFNKSTQKSRKGASGYTASTGGASFGFDTKANDDMTVGLALSLLHTDVKHKDFKSGDKTKADSIMFSIYGIQQITDSWFAQGIATLGSSEVTTNEKRRISDTSYQRATGKYTSMSFSGEALVGYNYVMEQMSVTPIGGIRFTRVNDAGYKETGTTNQNLTVSRKAMDKVELILGAKLAGSAFDLNGSAITPGIHAFLNQDMIGKNAKVNMRLPAGNQLVDKSSKPARTVFNAGVSLDTKYNSMEYGLGYDTYMANKYIGHQGTLKVRVNF